MGFEAVIKIRKLLGLYTGSGWLHAVVKDIVKEIKEKEAD